MSKTPLCVFGEVLYDCFPDGQQVLGGAPFNVAWHAQAFGLSPCLISRVGNDAEGERVLAAMRNWGMSLQGMQQDTEHPTGKVQVSLSSTNEPSYEIVAGSAWDYIRADASSAACDCELFYHGTLALRGEVSRASAVALRRRFGEGIFVDINLRAPWWDSATVQAQLDRVRGVKLNHEELRVLVPEARDIQDAAARFLATFAPRLLIVTLGSAGAMAFTEQGESARIDPGEDYPVIDTVGAGDAFMSVMLLGTLRGWPLPKTLQRAQDFATAIVGVRGATVDAAAFYQPFIASWGLS